MMLENKVKIREGLATGELRRADMEIKVIT